MRVVFRMSAIVAALIVAVASTTALTGCGQTGPLYLPTVPPLPPKPGAQTTATPPENAASDAEAASSPDASAPVTLAPADELAASSPRANRPSAASAASSSAPDQ
ncbi:MAG: hypothetical protein QOH33_547 [Paraburkholderia sp.]|nr:hypothetical protein [Paraburkholderia sp.]